LDSYHKKINEASSQRGKEIQQKGKREKNSLIYGEHKTAAKRGEVRDEL